MNFKRLREQLERYAINELSPELKNKVIDARKKQLADLEKQTNKETKNLNKKLADKEQEKAKNMKHKTSFERRLYKPIPVCKINGSLAQFEFFYPEERYPQDEKYKRHEDELHFEMTDLPVFSDTRYYPYITGHGSYVTYIERFDEYYRRNIYEKLAEYIQNNLEEINSIEIIDNKCKEIFYKKFGYLLRYMKEAETFLQKCPEFPNYAPKNEAYEMNEISDILVKSALDKTNQNLEQNKDDIQNINKEKESHIKDSQDKLNKLRNKINDLEGMRDKKDIEQRKQRRNYTQASYTGPEQDEKIAKKKLRSRKDELPRQYGDCLYSLGLIDDLLLKYNPTTENIEVWSNKYGKGYEKFGNTHGEVSDEYEYDYDETTLENIKTILDFIYEDTSEIMDDQIDTYYNTADVSGIKVLWRDFNELDLEDPKTYNLACFKLRYYSEERYRLI